VRRSAHRGFFESSLVGDAVVDRSCFLGIVGLLASLCVGCSADEPPQSQSAPVEVPALPATPVPRADAPLPGAIPHAPESAIHLRDVAAKVGVNFSYDTGDSGESLMVESTGGGGGWVDFDRDGDLDLYFCQGGNPKSVAQNPALDQLFRHNTNGQFVPVAPLARIVERGYGQGVSVADFDDDGFDDIYVSNYGPNTLLQNLGDGTFADVTESAGVGDPGWSTSTAWADLDGDHDLDLYVCNYAIYDVLNPQKCTDRNGRQSVCDPLEVDGQRDACFENLGDGRFQNVTERWGFNGTDDRSLGVAVLDLAGRGRPDVFIANDVSANFLYVNESAGVFRETGVVAGVAMNSIGNYQASMGVAVGDYDADELPDLYCTHFTEDSNTLYRNLGEGSFEDVTRFVGLHQPTLDDLGFGTVFTDFDADGAMDVFIANGHIADWRNLGLGWKMKPQLFTFRDGQFAELTEGIGDYFQREVLGRAVAIGDEDQDGDPDLVVVHQGDAAAVLRNESDRGRWLTLDFQGRTSNRRGWGVRVTARSGDYARSGWLAGGTSYCAAHEPAVFLGLGDVPGPYELTVHWPSGIVQTLSEVAADQRLTIVEPDPAAEPATSEQ
jgi:hypothetical protein